MRMTDEELSLPTDLPFDRAQPWRIKMVEYTKPTTREQRIKLLSEHEWTAGRIPAEYVYINMATDSGTGAMSDRQWSAMMLADESYFYCKSWYNFEEAVKTMTGHDYVIPSHQGRSAEFILYEALVNEGDIIPSNTHFTTTRAHAYALKAEPRDLVCKEYIECADRTDLFKGNVDLDALGTLIDEEGKNIPLVELVMPNNLNGGQPVSMENLIAVKKLLEGRDILLVLDAARVPENAYMIKTMEKGYADKSCLEISREMCSYADAVHMSVKKCGLVNMGGFVAVKDQELFKRLQPKVIRSDGYITYGGLAGRDLEANAVGILEGLNDYYLMDRQRQVECFADELRKRGVAIYEPPACFAVFIDAGKCLPHLEPMQGPASALSAQAYIEGGLGLTPFGSLRRAREDTSDPTNLSKYSTAPFELIRCAIPRRVYTEAHYQVAAEAVQKAMEWGDKVPAYHRVSGKGPELTYLDIGLKPFFNSFAPVSDHP